MTKNDTSNWGRVVSVLYTTIDLDEEIRLRIELVHMGASNYDMRVWREELWRMQANNARDWSSESLWTDWNSLFADDEDRFFRARTRALAEREAKRRIGRRVAAIRGPK